MNHVNGKQPPGLLTTTSRRPPKRKVALIRFLLPRIQTVLSSGQDVEDIWEALESEAL
jgi:hypothetical protein